MSNQNLIVNPQNSLNNIREYAELEGLVFANKMIENKQRFLDNKTHENSVLQDKKMNNLKRMKSIIERLEK